MTTKENEIEQKLIDKLRDLKYPYRPDIRDKAALELRFRHPLYMKQLRSLNQQVCGYAISAA